MRKTQAVRIRNYYPRTGIEVIKIVTTLSIRLPDDMAEKLKHSAKVCE